MNNYKILDTTDMSIDGRANRLCLVEYPDGHVGLVWMSEIRQAYSLVE